MKRKKLNKTITHTTLLLSNAKRLLGIACLLLTLLPVTAQQLTTQIDTTSIRIGEQLHYSITAQVDTSQTVIFPAAKNFGALEVVEAYPTDTVLLKTAKLKLLKKYALTQWDSGSYTIPKQKVLIDNKPFFTDSATIAVNKVVVDTTKQGLYDIKNAIILPKSYSNIWKTIGYIFLVLLVIAAFLFWLLKRHKKKIERERVIPPFEQAMQSLSELDTTDFLAQQEYKAYYTQLTEALRTYYDNKVYDRALESTTQELIDQLKAQKDSGQVAFETETIKQLEDVLKRADMVKFARIYPEQGKAQADRTVVENIIKNTREVLPQPTEEELLKDEAYQASLSRKRKRKLYATAIAGIIAIILTSTTIAIVIKGYDEVRDLIFGNHTRELVEGTWITSEYGVPSMVISTPKTLKRFEITLPDELKGKIENTMFMWESKPRAITVAFSQTKYPPKTEIDIQQVIDGSLKGMEKQGASFTIVKNEKFTTPNGAEGLKTFGTGKYKDPIVGIDQNIEYALLTFQAESLVQQLILTWIDEDKYSDQIARRILTSVELVTGDQE